MDDFAKRILNDVNPDEIAPTRKPRPLVDHWPPAVLLERAAYLRKLARYGNGFASEIIKEFPHYSVALSFLGRSGDTEVHHGHSCIFHVLAGTATLLTGGTVLRPRSAGTGEVAGTSIEGGETQGIRQGDVIHVPPGVAHQILVAGDKSITLLIVKVQESK